MCARVRKLEHHGGKRVVWWARRDGWGGATKPGEGTKGHAEADTALGLANQRMTRRRSVTKGSELSQQVP